MIVLYKNQIAGEEQSGKGQFGNRWNRRGFGWFGRFSVSWTRGATAPQTSDHSGSSAHSGRAGSSPASRTTFWPQIERFLVNFYIYENFSGKFAFRRFSLSFDRGPISNVFLTLFWRALVSRFIHLSVSQALSRSQFSLGKKKSAAYPCKKVAYPL